MALAVPAVPGLLALPTINSGALPRPVKARRDRIRLDKRRLGKTMSEPLGRTLDGQRPRHSRATDVIGTDNFRVAAFTWDGRPSQSALLFRAHDRRTGEWSEWFELHDDQHGPDLAGPEAGTARRGTDVVIVGESDAVEVRVETLDDELPADLYLELIDPGYSPADASVDMLPPGSAAASTPDFTIRTRAQWGADESIRDQSEPDYGSVRGAFVHHTAGSNSYTASDVPGIIRAIYTYHVNGRGWRDIGYNFLVDKFGRAWEGRYGGMTAAVVGAHVAGYNSYSTGASVLGTYTSKTPESAVLSALQQLIAWKFGIHGVNMYGSVAYPGLKTLPTIAGHRDGGSTECPGTELYDRLSALRSRVDAALWRTSTGQVYLFSGNQYARISQIGDGADSTYPRAIAGNWKGLPASFQSGLDAAFLRESNGKIYFFKGSQYVRISRVSAGVDSGYPRPIAGNWPGLPSAFTEGIDAAFWRKSNGKIYFFKGSEYVRISRVPNGVDAGYPRPIAGNWPGLPSAFTQGIDAALCRRDTGQIYFFKGPAYVRYSSVPSGIDPTYPRWIDPSWTTFPF
jgi:hypothetical protein